jgi:hypothetical protein
MFVGQQHRGQDSEKRSKPRRLFQMKTIAQFVANRITTLADLKDALQTAMQLEFSTIPPYLCAQWSINSDPSDVSDKIEDIVVQEMYHFALAGNMLTAIGGMPDVANAAFIPTYPTHVLPGGIRQALAVDLKPLTPDQVQVFMQIEYPEFPPSRSWRGPGRQRSATFMTRSPKDSRRSTLRSVPVPSPSSPVKPLRSRALPMPRRQSH